MQLDIRRLNLKLRRDFVISGGQAKIKQNYLVICEGIGLGEASASVAYGPDPDQIERDLNYMAERLKDVSIQSAGDVITCMSEEFSKPAVCAVSTAWHDFCARHDNQMLAQRFTLTETMQAETSVTVSIGDFAEIEEWKKAGFRSIKLKSDTNFYDAIDLINKNGDMSFRIDANGSWSENDAEEVVKMLSAGNVELIEQPFPPEEVDSWRRFKEVCDIPLFMDESIISADDVERVASHVDGVNIKIQKSGTLETACEALKRARTLGLKTMIGCMIESSVGIAAAMQFSSLADYCDLDGRLLLEDDDFTGLDYSEGRVTVSGKMGHGISEV